FFWHFPARFVRLRLHVGRFGSGDPHEDLVRVLRRAAQVLQVSVVERLEPPVDHPTGHSTTTPAPSSTRPTRRMKSLRESNSASSAGARSAAIETSRPPAVCGS